MAITSVGYAGSITDNNWRRMATAAVGSTYGVDDFASWRPTIGTGDRATQLADGGIFGLGVRDVSDGPISLTHAPSVSGSRWDLIVAHRNWSTKTTTPQIIQGSGVKALPGRDTGFGATNDQPIALVRVTAGQSVVQEIIDLRCIPGDGGILAFDELSLQYLNRPGTSVRIGDLRWDRVIDVLGSPGWSKCPAGNWSTTPISFTGIYGVGPVAPRLISTGGRNSLEGVAASTRGDFNAGTYYTLGSIPAAKAPENSIQYAVTLNGVLGGVAIAPSGTITFYSSATFTGQLWLSLAGASWADKSLL